MQNFRDFYFHILLFHVFADPSLSCFFVVDKVFCSNVQDKMEAMSVVWKGSSLELVWQNTVFLFATNVVKNFYEKNAGFKLLF